MVKLRFEVWESDHGAAMFQRGARNWKLMVPPDGRLIHMFEAETLYTAYQTYYDLMGWGKWNTTGIEDRAFTEEDVAKPDNEDLNWTAPKPDK
jgi:hypothetical protein